MIKLYTVKQYAQKIKKSTAWVKKLIKAGKLEAIKVNARMLLIKIRED